LGFAILIDFWICPAGISMSAAIQTSSKRLFFFRKSSSDDLM